MPGSKRPLALFIISIVTLVWAGNFAAGKFATAELHPFIITAARIILGAGFFLAMLPRPERRDVFKPSMLKLCLPLALTGIATNLFCFAAGIKLTVPTHSAIIHAMIPVGVFVIGLVILRERHNLLAVLGMLIAISGAVYIAFMDEHAQHGEWIGDLITLAGALAFSSYVVLGRRIIPKAGGAWRALTTGYLIAVPISIPFLAWGLLHQDWSHISWEAWAGTAYMIFGATFFCYAGHLWSLTHLEPLQVSVFVDIQPMLATAISAVLHIEKITGNVVLGGGIAVAGVALVQIATMPRAIGPSSPAAPAPAPPPDTAPRS